MLQSEWYDAGAITISLRVNNCGFRLGEGIERSGTEQLLRDNRKGRIPKQLAG